MKPALSMILIAISLTLMIAVAPAAAHAPADLVLSYGSVEGELQVTFTHAVADPSTHYLKKVSVEVEGGPDLLEQEYISQPTSSTFTYTYPLEIDPGTTIRVRGECNLGGEVEKELLIGNGQTTVTPTASTATPSTTATPKTTIPPTTEEAAGFTFPLAGISLAAAAAFLLRRA